MDENSANTCTGGVNDSCDSSGNGLDGAWNGNATVSPGKYGNSIVLDGSGDYTTHGSQSFSGTQITYSAWIYPTAFETSWPYISSIMGIEYTDGTTKGAGLRLGESNLTKDNVQWNLSINGVETKLQGNRDVPLNQWTLLTATYDGSLMKTYFNGELDTSYSITGTIEANNVFRIGALCVGCVGASREFTGMIDEVRVYNRALSDIEVQALYNYAPVTLAHWKFEEGSGITAFDSSGNAYNGTIVNSPAWTIGKYGSALGFTAANNNYLNAGSTINLANKSFTVEAWIKEDASQNNYILTQTAGISNNNVLHFYMGYNDSIACSFYNNDLSSTLTFSYDTNWHHVACTFDVTNRARKIYFDGVLAGSDTATANYQGSGTLKIAGAYTTNNNAFEGVIDDVRIYNYARTQAQIQEDMNNI